MGWGGGSSAVAFGGLEALVLVERGVGYFGEECAFEYSELFYVYACDPCGSC